jgi:hypothetical protein
MQYSPKLKVVMEEIKKILSDNDITGFVVLHTPGFSEYLNHVEASYSCAKVTDNGIEFKLSSKELGPLMTKLVAAGTYNMITHLSDVMAKYTIAYIDAHELLKKKWGGTEGPGSHTSHTQQNN